MSTSPTSLPRKGTHAIGISLLSGVALAAIAAAALPGDLGAAAGLGALGAAVVAGFMRLYRWAFECLAGGSIEVDCEGNPRGPLPPPSPKEPACASC